MTNAAPKLRALELYCGIGGFTAAVETLPVDVVAAIDISPHVVEIYNRNWKPVARQRDVLQLSADDLAAYEADLWWMSPPCAPYTRRGNELDVEDHRAQSYLHLLDLLVDVRPAFVALENVERFAESRARDLLLEALPGYGVFETVLCPTELGVPNKRPRYYLVASRDDGVRHVEPPQPPLSAWHRWVEEGVDREFDVPAKVVQKYGDGFHVMEPDEPYATCFTGSYGKSWNFTGSYFRRDDGTIRLFTPTEVSRFLGFERALDFPASFSRKQRWKYVGNSLSIPAVRHVLGAIGLGAADGSGD